MSSNTTDGIVHHNATHRHFRYGALCLIILMVMTASAYLLPAQNSDNSSADMTGNYVVSDSLGTYDSLEAAFTAINSASGTDFTITVYNSDQNVTTFRLNAGKNVTLISSPGHTFELTKASGRHGTVYGSLTIENIILDGNRTGGGINVNTSGTFAMGTGAVIQNCEYTSEGGGVSNYGTFNMYDGAAIQNCHATYEGGGVFNHGTFNMYGGKVSNNSAASAGGGVSNSAGGVINMSGNAVISYNSLANFVNNRSTAAGGGIFNTSDSVINMSGNALISNNSVSASATTHGAGVYNTWRSALYMSGNAVISDNFVTTVFSGIDDKACGGGISSCLESIIVMSDNAVVTRNKSAYYGGGVFNWMDSTFTMTGNAVVADNSVYSPILGSNNAYGGGVVNHTATFNMCGNAVITGNETIYGAGVFNIDGTFNMYGDAVVSNNNATARAGGVYNNNFTYGLKAIFNMYGNAVICNNTITAENSYGAGVFNGSRAVFNMSENVAIHDNTAISGRTVSAYGGGVFNNGSGIINMSGGEIYNNSAVNGGGISNSGTFTMHSGAVRGNTATGDGGGLYNTGTFDMRSGTFSDNTADYGGGAYNTDILTIAGGAFACNTANKEDSKGSGGGIYTTDFAKLTVAGGVTFTGNKAPTLRMKDIASDADIDGNGTPDLDDYRRNIGAVRLDAMANVGQNAPAYNNFDINYAGDTFVVYVDIEPDGTGSVTVADGGSGTVYGTLTADGYVHVPSTVSSITISAVPENGYGFKQFIIDGTPAGSGGLIVVPISGNMSVVAEFISKSAPPVGSKDYFINADADNGSKINPMGNVKVSAGDDRTFKFSAKQGYRITAVYVDGAAITSAELRSGTYTFYNVLANHTIKVVSEARGGGGDGDGGEEENVGKDEDGRVGGGDAGGDGEWAVLNLVCAIIAVFSGIVAIMGGRDRFKKGNEEKRSKTAMALRISALIVGIVSVIVFFLTEDWTLPVTPIDNWTLLMFVLLVVSIVMTLVSFRLDEGSTDEADTETDDN